MFLNKAKIIICAGMLCLSISLVGCDGNDANNLEVKKLIPYTSREENLMNNNNGLPENPNKGVDYNGRMLKEIWLAGGCFWGVEAYGWCGDRSQGG